MLYTLPLELILIIINITWGNPLIRWLRVRGINKFFKELADEYIIPKKEIKIEFGHRVCSCIKDCWKKIKANDPTGSIYTNKFMYEDEKYFIIKTIDTELFTPLSFYKLLQETCIRSHFITILDEIQDPIYLRYLFNNNNSLDKITCLPITYNMKNCKNLICIINTELIHRTLVNKYRIMEDEYRHIIRNLPCTTELISDIISNNMDEVKANIELFKDSVNQLIISCIDRHSHTFEIIDTITENIKTKLIKKHKEINELNNTKTKVEETITLLSDSVSYDSESEYLSLYTTINLCKRQIEQIDQEIDRMYYEFGIHAECERVEKLNELIKEIYYTWISTAH